MRLGLGLGLGVQQALGGAGGGADLPILRRVLVTDHTEEPIVLEFDPGDPVDYLVASDGTFDSLLVEDGTTFLRQEDDGKLIIQAN